MKILFSLLFVCSTIAANATHPSSWETTLKKGKGSITMYWHGSEPFIFHDDYGNLKGIEYDVFEGFKDYLKQTQNIDLEINWIMSNTFIKTFELIKNEEQSGFFGCSAFSITDNRKLVVDFSKSYLSDMAVLISSNNIPIMANQDAFKSVFTNLTAITIKGTTYEKELVEMKKKLNMNFKIDYIPSSGNILKALALKKNAFAYIDLSIYLTNLKKNPDLPVIRQNVYPIKYDGFGFIMPKNSDWQQPFNKYLNSHYYNSKSAEIIERYLEQDIYNLIKSISEGKQVNPDQVILLLNKEKEIQYNELLASALAIQKNRTLINSIIAAFILAVIGLVVLYMVYVNKVKSNNELRQHKAKIEEQQEDIENQHNAIEHRNKELIALNEEKNNLIHVLAHDLRTPINQISGLVQLHTLKHKNLSSEEQFTFDTIMGSIGRLNDMISKILNVDAIESQEANIKNEQVDLSALLNEEITEFIKEAEKKSITIDTSLPAKAVIMSDPIYLRQIIENLLSNAIKFSYPGSVINLSVTKSKEKVLIIIADHGPGFTQQDMKKIFGKFQRLSAKPTAGEPSTGLGLSIVKKYVDLLNASIECRSEMGKGATFTVYLPLG